MAKTNLEAIKAKMFPYELPEDTLEFLLDEQGLEPSEAYSRDSNHGPLIKAVIAALYQLITLVKEKDNGSEMQYDPDQILALIKRYENEDPTKKPQNRDMTHIW